MLPPPFITPLAAVSGELIQAIGSSSGYCDAAKALLALSWNLDAHLSHTIETRQTDIGMDYFIDHRRVNGDVSRDIFTMIRGMKDEIGVQYPLLAHAADLTEYVSHVTTNLLPLADQEPRLLASVFVTGDPMMIHDSERISFEWSLAIYFGLSPLPLFGAKIPYDERIGRRLSYLGMGVFAYLSLALHPELAVGDRLPGEIDYQGIPRPVAEARFQRLPDGSLGLISSGLFN